MSVVTITRFKDPLDGQQVRVLGRLRRHGEAELLVVLPDGSKRMIPLSWTDAQPAGECDRAATLGGLGDLLAACVLVAALSDIPWLCLSSGSLLILRVGPCFGFVV